MTRFLVTGAAGLLLGIKSAFKLPEDLRSKIVTPVQKQIAELVV